MATSATFRVRQAINSESAWKAVLALLLAGQVLALAVSLARLFWEKESTWLPASAISLLSALGILLWCVESVSARPALTRFALRCVLVTFLGWIAVLFLQPFQNTESRRKEIKSEATRQFFALVKRGQLPPPSSAEDLNISQRGMFLQFRYTDEQNRLQLFSVHRTHEPVWIFRNAMTKREVKARPNG